jgi:hypothetical protein
MSKITDENSHSALNLTSSRGLGAASSRGTERPISSNRTSHESRRSEKAGSDDGSTSLQAEIRKKMRDNIGMSYISPTTGKKRVQCNVCLKTFCDKGALKIHFSAVHLREMHKCSVEGCNMMFSSRRSRNRHSSNPNPKLHTPHLRRKISPHDGRTHQGPFLPGLAALAVNQSPQKIPGGGGFPGMPPLHHGGPFAAGMAPNMLTPENLQNFQRQQMELHRLHEFKMNTMYNSHQNFDAKKHAEEGNFLGEPDSKRIRMSDSENDEKEEDGKSLDNQSAKDEVSSGTQSAVGLGGGSKRKSKNPTRITHLAQRATEENEDEEFSSDDDDEGFENPLDDNDDDDLDNDDGDDDLPGSGAGSGNGGGSSNNADKQSPPGPGGNGDQDHHPQEPKYDNQKIGGEAAGANNDSEEQKAVVNGINDNNNSTKETAEDMFSDPGSPIADIPLDKENPMRCVECGKEFSNHFDVKHHYQNVHLRMMHKCTVEGCNAGFPSKRSRDRHSSNLNLHRKLLSTTSNDDLTTPSVTTTPAASAAGAAVAPNAYQSELFARLYAEHQQLRAGAAVQHQPQPGFGGLFGFGGAFNSADLEAKTKEFAAAAAAAASAMQSPDMAKYRHMTGLMAEVGSHSHS